MWFVLCINFLWSRILSFIWGGFIILNKKIILALSLFIIICIASLCVVVADSNSSKGSFKDLAAEVSGNDKTGTIILTKDYVNNGSYNGSGIKITGKNLIIKSENGPITIDANNSGRIFDVNNTQNVTFENIIFKNGNVSGAGGAGVLGDNSSSAVNCQFENCRASEFGGALVGNAVNSTFSGCSAKYHGGAIFQGSARDCKFNKCFSESCGGAISYNTAVNCNFNDCYAYWQGGCLYQANAMNCHFVNTFASEGGAMYGGSAFGSYFEHCEARNGSGGAIYSGSAIGCNFEACSANNGSGSAMYGGSAIDCNLEKEDATNVDMGSASSSYKFEDSFFSHIFG